MLPSNTIYHEGVPENFGAGGINRLVNLEYLLNYVYSKHVSDLLGEAVITEISA